MTKAQDTIRHRTVEQNVKCGGRVCEISKNVIQDTILQRTDSDDSGEDCCERREKRYGRESVREH